MSLIQRNIQLNKEDVDWLESTYPRASLSAFLQLLLEKFRLANTKTPIEYAEIAARELKEEMDG